MIYKWYTFFQQGILFLFVVVERPQKYVCAERERGRIVLQSLPAFAMLPNWFVIRLDEAGGAGDKRCGVIIILHYNNKNNELSWHICMLLKHAFVLFSYKSSSTCVCRQALTVKPSPVTLVIAARAQTAVFRTARPPLRRRRGLSRSARRGFRSESPCRLAFGLLFNFYHAARLHLSHSLYFRS